MDTKILLLKAHFIKQDLCPCYLCGSVLHARGILKGDPFRSQNGDKSREWFLNCGLGGMVPGTFQGGLQGQNYILHYLSFSLTNAEWSFPWVIGYVLKGSAMSACALCPSFHNFKF